MHGLRYCFAVGISAAAVLLGVTSCTPDQLHALEGTLQKMDSVSGNVTVKLQDGTFATFNFNNVNVETIRKTLGNASFDIGDNITVRTDVRGKVKGIGVYSAQVEGIITARGADNVTIRTEKKREIVLLITPATVFKLEGKTSGNFSDIKVGQQVEARYDVNTRGLIKLSVGDGRDADDNSDDDRDEDNDSDENESDGRRTQSETTPRIPHSIVDRANCLSCHGQNGIEAYPRDHFARTDNSACLACHTPRS